MDKNIIKNYLKAFVSEAVSPTPASTPALKLAKKIGKEEGKQNKQGVEAIAKDMTSYEKALTKDDPNQKSMAPNKYNYDGDNEVNYHDQMEIMNGQEMIQYDREPGSRFKERAMKAIEGDSTMGNNPEWANVVQKGWGGDPEFGKNLVKQIKASEKKRTEQTPTSKMFGNDWEVVKDKGHKAYAFEGTRGKSLIKENIEFDLKPIVGQGDQLKDATHFAIHKATNGIASNWDYSDRMPRKPMPPKDKSNKRAVTIYKNKMAEYKEELKDINDEFRNAANDYFFYDLEDNVGGNMDNFKKSDFTIVTRDGLAKRGIDLNNYKWFIGQKYDNTSNDSDLTKKGEDAMKGLDADYEKDSSAQQYGINPYQDMEENTKNNKKQIKETMKRLKFNKEFNGFGNALKLIPESYKVDKKVFEMTDGNEHYRIRWEGSINEGSAVILMASDKNLVNEDMERMKRLMGYKSQETLGTVKGKERITENAKFNDIWNKTKKLMNEVEDNDGGAEEDEWDDAITSQAPEAKKNVQGSASADKGTSATAKTGHFDKAITSQSPEAKKNVQGSASTDKGTSATAKTGHWDAAVKSQAAEAKKNMQSSLKKKLSEAFDDEEIDYDDLKADDARINRLEAGMSGEEDDAPIVKRKDAYDASLDVTDPEDMEKSITTTDIEKSASEPMINKDIAGDDEDDVRVPELKDSPYKLMKNSKGEYGIILSMGGKKELVSMVPDEYIELAIKDPSAALDAIKADKEMSDDDIMETLNEILSEMKKK
jgi:hypothetical protein